MVNFINEHHLNDWINVYYSKQADEARIKNNEPGYSQLYDVQSFPTLHLLDKNKKFVAKKLAVEQIDEFLEFLEKKKTEKK